MNDYSDIIDLPHPVSKRHPRMPLEKRAAQFAPFEALSGLEEKLDDTARSNQQNILDSESGIPFEDAP
ncbi:MAG: hypothetical protein K6B44_02230 [Lachnospiraceae bacterium]|nr:hypothetical protein [Lachnospiraceae bacterium]